MKYIATLCLTLLFCISISICMGQNVSIAERLGYSSDAKLLILHADDLGVAHSVNAASFTALESGAVSSASIMVPCPWLLEVAMMAKEHPDFDLGLHLTLTAEWEKYKWDGVLPVAKIPSLINKMGYFYDNDGDVQKKADPEQVRMEIQAQIDRARELGINPTHLDSHMGSLFLSPELFKVYVETGIQNHIPVFIPLQVATLFNAAFPKPEDVVIVNHLDMMSEQMTYNDRLKAYMDIVKSLQPGLNEIIVHLGHADPELQAVTVNHSDFGSEWRALDLKVVESQEFRDLLKSQNIQLVRWKQIKEIVYP